MITDIRLQSFRSYGDAAFDIDSGVNIIVGPNASGKTNLLEAVLLLATGSSYRAKDYEMIGFDKPWARLDAHDDKGSVRTLKLFEAATGRKEFEIHGKTLKRLSFKDSLPVVLFEPNHLLLLTGSPQGRRDYLDDLLEQTEPGFGVLRRNYKRTLAQRNSLLKQPNANTMQLFPWNIRLSELAGQIVRNRLVLIDALSNTLGSLYGDLSKTKTAVDIQYITRFNTENYESQLLQKLESNLELERLRGFTAYGPHRDDMVILFDGRPASETASRGETRTAVLALKIMELESLAVARANAPLLLLDDVFSELDGARRKALTSYLKNYQTFITTTDADVVLQNFTETCRIIPLGG